MKMEYEILNIIQSGLNELSKFKLIIKDDSHIKGSEKRKFFVWPPKFLFYKLEEKHQNFLNQRSIKIIGKYVTYHRIFYFLNRFLYLAL